MNTGVDAQTCKLIVLDQRIQSMTVFKQIIGRGTRINEDFNKFFFTIMDFKKATELFADPKFDGEPVVIYQPKPGGSPLPPDEGGDDGSRRIKYVVNDVPVKVVAERVQFMTSKEN
jgi:type I restriction enzyme, R subunit